MPVPANIVLAVLAHIGGPLMTLPSPAQPADPGGPPHPQLTISIADNVREVRAGQRVRYHIMVKNPTETETPVTVRLTLPPAAVSGIKAQDATVVANAVAWRNRLEAGAARSFLVTGTVERHVDLDDLAITACLHPAPQAAAVTCATDHNAVAGTRPQPRPLVWIASIVFGLLAVAGAVWLQRKVQPEPLTPANAATAYGDDSGQPGGAPSV